MNPLTLDFMRRWKWLLVIQFVATSAAWVSHAAQPQARLHLEVFIAVAMSWDLMRGLVRSQLGLPQRRESIAAGLWLSVVGVGAATHVAGMLLGGGVLAPMLGFGLNAGVMGLHLMFCLILIGAVQFILTGLPSTPPRSIAGQVKGAIFGGLWGLQMFGSFWLAMAAPAGWSDLRAVHSVIIGLLGVMAVASWFTTRRMMMERAMPKLDAVPPKPAKDPRALFLGTQGWRLRWEQEGRWLLPILAMVLMAALIMISINDFSGRGSSPQAQPWMYQYRTMGMIFVILAFPLVMVAVGSLRAWRGLPVPLSHCALMVALRPFLGGLVVFLGYTLLNVLLGRGTGMAGRALLVFLPLCSLMSLLQAVILRFPYLPVAFGLLMFLSMTSGLIPEMIKLSLPPFWPPVVAGGMLAVSWGLHVRWLGKSSRIYRVNQGFLRMMAGGGQR